MANSDNLFKLMMKNITKSKTYKDLVNCHDWVKRSEFQLKPSDMNLLLGKIREKEKSFEEGLEEIMKEKVGKIQ